MARASRGRSRSARGLALACLAPACLALASLAVARADERQDLEARLEKAISSKDAEGARTLLVAATKAGDERAARLVVSILARLKPLQAHAALVEAMKQAKDEAAIQVLVDQALKGTYAENRWLFVEGLAAQGSPAAAAAVLEALDDKDEAVAICAARGARSLAAADTVEKLIARLEKAEARSNEATLAREVLGALGSVTGESLSFALEWKAWWVDRAATWKPRPAPSPSPTATPSPAPSDKPSDKPSAEKPAEPATVLERLRRDRPEDARVLEKLKDDDVIVVRGEADNLGPILGGLKIKHREIPPEDVGKTKLAPTSVLVLCCNNRKNPYSEVELAQIREFVEKGGYLVTADAQLRFLLARAFPGSAVFDKIYVPARRGEALKAGIGPAAARHPLLRDVFPPTAWDGLTFAWTLEPQIEVGRPSPEALVLVTSPDAKKVLEDEVLAFAFRWHKGKVVPFSGPRASSPNERPTEPEGGCVLHVVPHFHVHKDKDAGDHFALEQLVLNFILERQRVTRLGD